MREREKERKREREKERKREREKERKRERKKNEYNQKMLNLSTFNNESHCSGLWPFRYRRPDFFRPSKRASVFSDILPLQRRPNPNPVVTFDSGQNDKILYDFSRSEWADYLPIWLPEWSSGQNLQKYNIILSIYDTLNFLEQLVFWLFSYYRGHHIKGIHRFIYPVY